MQEVSKRTHSTTELVEPLDKKVPLNITSENKPIVIKKTQPKKFVFSGKKTAKIIGTSSVPVVGKLADEAEESKTEA